MTPSPDPREWSVWCNYNDLTVCVRQGGRHDVHLMPDEAREKAEVTERLMGLAGIEDPGARAFIRDVRECADTIEEIRARKSDR